MPAEIFSLPQLWPAVPKNLKRVVVDDIIQPVGEKTIDGLPDVDVRGGETVLWSDWCMARMPEIWGDDCLEFKPERFLETDSDGRMRVKEFSQFKFHSFNAGPRLVSGSLCVMTVKLSTYSILLISALARHWPLTREWQ